LPEKNVQGIDSAEAQGQSGGMKLPLQTQEEEQETVAKLALFDPECARRLCF